MLNVANEFHKFVYVLTTKCTLNSCSDNGTLSPKIKNEQSGESI
jgi:hypothetical protein